MQICCRQSRFIIDWHHIKNHQDRQLIMALPWAAWLNIEADNLAKTKVNPNYHDGPDQYHLPGEGWVCQCSIGPQQIVKQLAFTLWSHVNGIPAEKYWKTKFKLSDNLWGSIKWQRHERVYQQSLWLHNDGQLNILQASLLMGRIWLGGTFDPHQAAQDAQLP